MSTPRAATARAGSGRSAATTRRGKHRTARSSPSGARSRSRAAAPQSRAKRPRPPAPRLRVAPSRPGRLRFLVASFVLVGILVVGVASLQAVVSQGSFRMQDLSRRNVELREEYGRLKLEVAELSAPGRIAARARRLGFRLPRPGEVSTLTVKGAARADGVSGTLNAPAVSLRSLLEQRP